MNYNEPVTNIILDMLAKVQAHALDFSSFKIPKHTPMRSILADAQMQTSITQTTETPIQVNFVERPIQVYNPKTLK